MRIKERDYEVDVVALHYLVESMQFICVRCLMLQMDNEQRYLLSTVQDLLKDLHLKTSDCPF